MGWLMSRVACVTAWGVSRVACVGRGCVWRDLGLARLEAGVASVWRGWCLAGLVVHAGG